MSELILTKRFNLTDSHTIGVYESTGGWLAARKAMKDMTPEAVVAEVKKSNLRGRGGAAGTRVAGRSVPLRNGACTGADAGQHVVEQVAERAEVVERQAGVCRQAVLLSDLAEQLRLANAVDSQVRFQIQIQVEHVRRISSLLGDDFQDFRLHRILGSGLSLRRRLNGCRLRRGSRL